MQHPGHFNTVINWAIENDLVANGEAAEVWGQFRAQAPQKGLFSQEHELLIEGVKEVVGGGGIVFGNIEPDIVEILARLLHEAIAAHEVG